MTEEDPAPPAGDEWKRLHLDLANRMKLFVMQLLMIILKFQCFLRDYRIQPVCQTHVSMLLVDPRGGSGLMIDGL